MRPDLRQVLCHNSINFREEGLLVANGPTRKIMFSNYYLRQRQRQWYFFCVIEKLCLEEQINKTASLS